MNLYDEIVSAREKIRNRTYPSDGVWFSGSWEGYLNEVLLEFATKLTCIGKEIPKETKQENRHTPNTTKTIVLTLEEYSRLKDCETKLYELEAAALGTSAEE